MTEKRFTMCHEQNDLNGWTMSIIDWETKQPFDYTQYEVHSSSITDTKDEMEDLCLLLNELHEENLQLKDENKKLKEKIKLIFRQIKAFRNDCVTYSYFEGAGTLNRLSDILKSSMEIWK